MRIPNVSARIGLALLCVASFHTHAEIRFRDVTTEAGFNRIEETWGAAWGDFNGDGRADIFVGNHAHDVAKGGGTRPTPSLYLNQGDGTFVDIATSVIVGVPAPRGPDCHGQAWADFDNDGDWDLMHMCSRADGNVLYINEGGQLRNRAGQWGLDYPELRGRTPLWLDWNNDGLLDQVQAGFRDKPGVPGIGEPEIFARVGDHFEKRAQQTGFACTKKTLFAVLSDVTGDGVLDLICAFTPFPQKIYDMTTAPFTDLTDKFPARYPKVNLAQDVAIADFNGDALPDMFVSRMARPFPGNPLPPTLLRNTGTGFIDRTAASNLNVSQICRSVVAADFDNDMDVDIYRVCSASSRNNILHENLGSGTFKTVANAGGAPGSNQGVGDSAIFADYDEDGFIDLFVTNGWWNGKGPHQLYRNVSGDPGRPAAGNHWLQIDLRGTISNPHGIGARVLVTAGGVTQLREQSGGIHLYSQNFQRLHFGLGRHAVVANLTIHWPSGVVQELTDLQADRIYEIVEDQGPGGTAEIGDFVWEDTDADGIQDPGESGKSGVTVRLRLCNGSVRTTTTTDADGKYLFERLVAGDYQIEFAAPSGFAFSPPLQGTQRGRDSDPDQATGLTSCLPMADGQSRLGIDAGLIRQAAGDGKIGDRVWQDLDGDGIQDPGEPGMPGVTVNLQTCATVPVDTTTTDDNGRYLFDNLVVGKYQVEFLAPDGYTLSPREQGSRRGLDSNPFPDSGLTRCLPIAEGQVRLGIDAGMVP